MRRLLLPLLLAALATACSGPAAAAPRPSPSAAAASSPAASPGIDPRAPVNDILVWNEIGMSPVGGADHLSLTQAASEQQNQPLALTEYRAWGWVDEATRAWGDNSTRADEALLLLTRPEGAGEAFRAYTNQLLKPPLTSTACAADLGLDQCAVGRSGSQSILVGRLDRYVMRFQGLGVDVERLARLQATKIRR